MAKEIFLVKEQICQVCGFLVRNKLFDTKIIVLQNLKKGAQLFAF